MPVYSIPHNPLLPQIDPKDAIMGLATPLGITSEAGGLGRILSHLFTPNEEGAMADIGTLYRKVFNRPIELDQPSRFLKPGESALFPTKEVRDPLMEPARRYIGQYDKMDPDLREHVKNAFLAGMRHGGNIVAGGK